MKKLLFYVCFWLLHWIFMFVHWLTKGTNIGMPLMCRIFEINTCLKIALLEE